MVFEASASRSMSASACDARRRRRALGEEALDAREQFLHLLTAGFGVELGALEGFGMPESRRSSARRTARSADWRPDARPGRLVPAAAQRPYLFEHPVRGVVASPRRVPRRECLDFGHERLAVGLFHLELNLVAPLVAVEDIFARAVRKRCQIASDLVRRAPDRSSSTRPAADDLGGGLSHSREAASSSRGRTTLPSARGSRSTFPCARSDRHSGV